jgi:ABC-type phosphate transport system substrate-binding protein
MFNSRIGAAVAAALSFGVVGVASAAAPTPTAAAGAQHSVYVAGSSAAANAVINYIETTVFGNGTFSVFTTPTSAVGLGDFRAVSGTVVAGQAFPNGSTLTVYYRPEGGSVIGALALFNDKQVKQLNLTAANCSTTAATSAATAAYTCTSVSGTASLNGSDDSWSGGVVAKNIDIGVSDLEPGVFSSTGTVAGGGAQDPVASGAYSTTFVGNSATSAQLQGLEHFIPIQQTFGFVVHNDVAVSDLQKEQIAAIFDGFVSDWSQVPRSGTTGTIIVCNREVGSGTRAAADIFLNGIGCVPNATSIPTLSDGVTQPDNNLQTIAELDCVNSHAKSIGYVSIDNFAKLPTSFTSTKSISVSSAPAAIGSLTAPGSTDGTYDMWFEASVNENAHNVGGSPRSADGQALYNALKTNLPSKDINVGSATTTQVSSIPGQAGNSVGQVGAKGVQVSWFSRGAAAGGNSCQAPTHG